ncbi:hypothetical protein [Gorillibacterium massiliense]|uniref:hypothetical protein n=1 Tax=Gorillibacterium massiliense TaxID=1280390 RepID=UPI0004B54F6E|nr:hypothetical protein [Gorillibacterium massiliense]
MLPGAFAVRMSGRFSGTIPYPFLLAAAGFRNGRRKREGLRPFWFSVPAVQFGMLGGC